MQVGRRQGEELHSSVEIAKFIGKSLATAVVNPWSEGKSIVKGLSNLSPYVQFS